MIQDLSAIDIYYQALLAKNPAYEGNAILY